MANRTRFFMPEGPVKHPLTGRQVASKINASMLLQVV
jgi:hypothetical protein